MFAKMYAIIVLCDFWLVGSDIPWAFFNLLGLGADQRADTRESTTWPRSGVAEPSSLSSLCHAIPMLD